MTQHDQLQTALREMSYTDHQDQAQQLIDAGWVLIPELESEQGAFLTSEETGLTTGQAVRVQSLVNFVLDSTKVQAETAVVAIKDYKVGDRVEVMREGTWLPGQVSALSQNKTNLHVDTEKGPLTLQNKTRVRRPTQVSDEV